MKFFKWLIGLFRRGSRIDLEVLDSELVMNLADSQKFYIGNGRSWFMGGGNPDLYENNHLRVGLGLVRSGYGDWGGGFSQGTVSNGSPSGRAPPWTESSKRPWPVLVRPLHA